MGVTAMLVMPMAFMVMIMVVAAIMIIAMRSRRHRGHRLLALQRAKKSSALGPDQFCAERRDQCVACEFDGPLRPAHGFRGGVEQPGADADDRYRDQRLHPR